MDKKALDEAVRLSAVSLDYYNHFFFPKAFRQESAPFHADVHKLLLSTDRYVAIKMFRGSAKTTNLRSYISNRIAYGVSRTILYVGPSEDSALKTLDWIRRNVQYNALWRDTFGLEKGEPWSATQLCIMHNSLGHEVRVLGIGIHGSTRGINIDDYRPDLIVVDDVMGEENSATPEARKKIKELLGGLRHSLAPKTDCPEAKFVMLQTPFNEDDAIEEAMRDPQFSTLAVSCFNPDGGSAWPARWSTETLMEDKDAHIARKQLALWLREMEVTVTSDENTAWDTSWLKYWVQLPGTLVHFMGVDPTPPPKEGSPSSMLERLDDSVVMDIGLYKGETFVVEYYCAKSPNPDELINKIFEFYLRYRPQVVSLETILFARTIKYYLEKEMKKRGVFMRINPVEDKRKKSLRILQTVSGRASTRTINVHQSHTAFIEQYARYPQVVHDDIIDAFCIALMGVSPMYESNIFEGEYSVIDDKIPALPNWRSAP